MAENVVLSVQLQGAELAIAQMTQLDGLVKSLKSNRNVNLTVNSRSLGTAAASAEKLSTNLSGATASAQKLGTTGAKSVTATGEAIGKASRNAESFRIGMGSVLVNMAKFRLASTAINLVANAFTDAVKEMKAVDTELVNIRKVTGFANDEIQKLTKSAYSLATNYGRSASEVLTASTVFARAGYKEQIEQLSELSLLLQNVGDLQAEDASKFVIATDKAYKLGGSYEDLMKIIDGLDNITNRNATDMQKMTEGMTVAGSVFAESGESVETFAALLGTATANTQRSGSEVARGLRTILMNLRQIRGETEDGELIDGESIANAAKALKDYAGISTMENGQLRKASDVLADLAGKWDTLNETQRAAISEAVAGKRQANILMSLMGDWESVQRMMQQYEEGAGTAAKENAMYMDSWAAKTAQVKSAWTELIASLTDTRILKGFLDLTSGLLKGMTELVNGPSDEKKRKISAKGSSDELTNSLEFGLTQFENYQNTDALISSMQEAIDKGQEYYKTLQDMKRAGQEWTTEETQFIASFDALQKGLGDGVSSIDAYGYAVAAMMLAMGHSAEEAADEANQAIDDIKEEFDTLPEEKTITVNVEAGQAMSAFRNIKSVLQGNQFASGTKSAPGGPALVNENGPEMISANGLAWIAGGGKPTVTMLPKGATVLTASETRTALGGKSYSGLLAYKDGTRTKRVSEGEFEEKVVDVVEELVRLLGGQEQRISASDLGGSSSSGMTDAEYYAAHPGLYEQYNAARKAGRSQTPTAGRRGGGGYDSGPAAPTPPDFKKLEEELSKTLKNLDAQAKLAENEEDLLKAMQVYGDAQTAIAELLEQYRANGYAEDSDEVLRLANLGYDYAAKQLGGYDKLQQNLIDALNALTSSTDKANELAERQEAVEKAREALANAERQRTVRIFNPVTGQWEWVANAADVQKAQDNLKNAEEALRKEELSQAVDAIKNAKPGELGDMALPPAILEALMSGTPEQQSAFLSALGAASGGADWLASSGAQTAWNQGTSIGTQYNLGNITLTEAQAENMTIKQLIATLQGLKLM